jgi:hypothetical protein
MQYRQFSFPEQAIFKVNKHFGSKPKRVLNTNGQWTSALILISLMTFAKKGSKFSRGLPFKR